MEANLNQFRLFTVRAEHEVNDRRGGNSGRETSLYRRRNPGLRGEDGSQPQEEGDQDNDGQAAEEGSESGENSIHQETLGDRRAEDNEMTGEDILMGGLDGAGGAEKSLVGALISLEHTINQHCQLLNKKLRRERAVLKNTTSDTARTPIVTSALPKVAFRTDKVSANNWVSIVFVKFFTVSGRYSLISRPLLENILFCLYNLVLIWCCLNYCNSLVVRLPAMVQTTSQ